MELTKTVYKTRDEIINELERNARTTGILTRAEFLLLIETLLISENGYVTDCGNAYQVWAEMGIQLIKKVKKHPRLWKRFFMVA